MLHELGFNEDFKNGSNNKIKHQYNIEFSRDKNLNKKQFANVQNSYTPTHIYIRPID